MFLRGLSAAALKRLLGLGALVEVRPGGHFFEQGTPADRLYLLLSGRVRVHFMSREGRQFALRFQAPGDIFGISGFSFPAEYRVSAEAIVGSAALAWDHQAIRRLTRAFPELALNVVAVVLEYFREYQERAVLLSAAPAEVRVGRMLLQLAEQIGRPEDGSRIIDGGFLQQDLADLTGTTIFTVSRVLTSFERAGLLRKSRGRIRIADTAALQARLRPL